MVSTTTEACVIVNAELSVEVQHSTLAKAAARSRVAAVAVERRPEQQLKMLQWSVQCQVSTGSYL